jgi:DNA-binding transcriptional MocR family regulator
MLDLEQYQIGGSTAREIASSVEAAIREGLLDAGAQLPTVRALAARLGTSTGTVNSAYRILRERGLAIGDGRRGTRVAPRPALRTPERGLRLPAPPPGIRDLAVGMPDPELLPDARAALARVDVEENLALGWLEAANPKLLGLAAAAYEADGLPGGSIAVLSGAFDAVERVLQAHLRPGDRVIVEDPTYISIRDILISLGLVAVPVPVDDLGLEPAAFERRLEQGVEGVMIVPRAQNPLGAATDAERMAALRTLLEPYPDVLVVEDDHAGPVSGASFSTLVTPASRRWAVVRSTSKVLHPDLRLALMAADPTTVARVEGRQALGPRWVSHLLQAIVAEMLDDPGFEATTARARQVYGSRRNALLTALGDRGVPAHGRSGMNVWVPVREEAPVVAALLDAGWQVMAGERFRIDSPPGVRITIASLREEEAEAVADVVAATEHAGRPRRLY